jgi:hypothetical protein
MTLDFVNNLNYLTAHDREERSISWKDLTKHVYNGDKLDLASELIIAIVHCFRWMENSLTEPKFHDFFQMRIESQGSLFRSQFLSYTVVWNGVRISKCEVDEEMEYSIINWGKYKDISLSVIQMFFEPSTFTVQILQCNRPHTSSP